MMEKQKNEKKYICRFCGKEFKSKQGKYLHEKKKHREQWEKAKSNKISFGDGKVQKFKLEVINISEKKKEGEVENEKEEEEVIYRCPVCHKKVPPDSLVCPYCGAEFEE